MDDYFLAISSNKRREHFLEYFSSIPIKNEINNTFPVDYEDSIVNLAYKKSIINGCGSITEIQNIFCENNVYDTITSNMINNHIKKYIGKNVCIETAISKNNGKSIEIFIGQTYGILNGEDVENFFIPQGCNKTLNELKGTSTYRHYSPTQKAITKLLLDFPYIVLDINIDLIHKSKGKFIDNIIKIK